MSNTLRLLVLLVLVAFSFPSNGLAQDMSAGIGISPAIIEKPAAPSQQLEEVVNVKNLSAVQQKYYLFARDIVGVEGNGTPIFADSNQEKTGFEMSEWISLGVTEVDLAPEQEVAVPVTIKVPDQATPGSHFAGIFVSMDPPEMRTIGAAVAYQVANIVSIRVAGEVIEDANIRQFSTGNYVYGDSNVDFEARIANDGSTLIRPVGPLEIYNMFGKRVSLITVNESKGAVFPKSERVYEMNWNDEGPGFGRYEAVISLVYGEQGGQKSMSSTVTFWILPMNIVLPALGALAALLLVTFVAVRIYVRRTLQVAASGSRRIVRRRRSGMPPFLLMLIVMGVVTTVFLLFLLIILA